MRMPVILVIIAASVVALIVILTGIFFLDPDRPLIMAAGFQDEMITPNADGENDVTAFSFNLSRKALVTITLTNEDGQTFDFRRDQRHVAGDYNILFSGVVGGYTLPDDTIDGRVERRLIPDGNYTWTMKAADLESDEMATASGTFVITEADSMLPVLSDFSIAPETFTPNQDGVTDRVGISVFLQKDAELTAYLLDSTDDRIYLRPRRDIREAGTAGRHEYDFDGGIDDGANPPADGTYRVVIEAQDAVGQRVAVEGELTIEQSGNPRAEIVGQMTGPDVVFTTAPYDPVYFSSDETGLGELIPPPDDPQDLNLSSVTVPVGDMLVFSLVIENYGTTPIRTSGPPPGTVYQQDQLPPALGEFEQAGVWRVGIQCATSEAPYPWRWAVGADENLVQVADPSNDNLYSYLMPGERSVVWGAVRMTELIPTFNPQVCFAGLIHEGVEISLRNNRVGAREILLAETAAED